MDDEKKKKLIFLAICFFIVFLVFGRSILGDFVFDDRRIVEHRYILDNFRNFHKVLTLPYWTEETGLYRPVTLASYAFNYVFLGAGPEGFHLINLIFYALSGYLIFLLIKNLFKSSLFAYLTAILFLVLPIHTEAAANIVGRAEILALFFSLLVFWELTREKINFWRIGAWSLMALGSKETAIAVLPISLFLIYCKEKRFFAKEIFTKYLYPIMSIAGGAIIYFAVRFFVLGGQYFIRFETSIVENPLKFAPALPRIITAFKILAVYLKKTFLPFGLCSDYSYNQIPILHNFLNTETILGVSIFSFLIACFFMFLKRLPPFSFASAFFILSFLVVSNLIFPIGTIAGERLMYFPSLGLIIYLAAILLYLYFYIRPLKILNWIFCGLGISLIIFYGTVSFHRTGDWLTEKQLFVSAVKCAPNSVLSRSNLGAAYYLEGNLVEAKKELLQAQEIYDNYPKGVNNLGLVYWKEGNKEKAKELFLKALSYRFPYYGAYENLALMALEENNLSEAKNWLMKFYSGNEKSADTYIEIYQLIRIKS